MVDFFHPPVKSHQIHFLAWTKNTHHNRQNNAHELYFALIALTGVGRDK